MNVTYKMSLLLKLYTVLFLYSMSNIIFTNIKIDQSNLAFKPNHSSSVWCKKDQTNHSFCTFTDICYSSKFKTFLFFLTNKTVISGITVNDLKNIQLSSIHEHNAFFMNLTLVTEGFNGSSELQSIYFKPSFLLSRFKPDNIMHSLHDDMLPLFLTLEELCHGNYKHCLSNYNIIFHDTSNEDKMYQVFFKIDPLILLKSNSCSCFKTLKTGLIIDSKWFQYGFKNPQGPLDSKLTSRDISRYTSFVAKQLDLTCNQTDTSVILLSRSKNRRILNEDYITQVIINSFPDHQLEIYDIATHNVSQIIQRIMCNKILIGMHGSAMILTMFLKPQSLIVELFPYAIRAEHVSFVKSMCMIKGLNHIYKSWHNVFQENTIAHPDFPPLQGGINHLPRDLQSKIKSLTVIPPVKCCHNPAYLYRMFQDTWVSYDFEETLTLAHHDLISQNHMSNDNNLLFPALISNFSLVFDKQHSEFLLSWTKPFNMDTEDILEYFITYHLVSEINEYSQKIYYITTTNLVRKPIKFDMYENVQALHIWISSQLLTNKIQSSIYYTKCALAGELKYHNVQINCN